MKDTTIRSTVVHGVQRDFNSHPVEYITIMLMIVFMISNVDVPKPIASLIDSLAGRVIVILGSLSLLVLHRPLGIVSLVFAYELIQRSEMKTGTYQTRTFLPSETRKGQHFDAMNQFPTTLEEEVVAKMVPLVRENDADADNAEHQPVLSKIYGAAML